MESQNAVQRRDIDSTLSRLQKGSSCHYLRLYICVDGWTFLALCVSIGLIATEAITSKLVL